MNDSGVSLKKILVVEDEPAIGEVCLRVLTGEGFEVDIAANGSIAQQILEDTDYDICLIDVRTPVMNGKQLYQIIINKHPELAKGVIFSTGDVLDGYTERFLELTGRPFLAKPFTPDELKAIVRGTLSRI